MLDKFQKLFGPNPPRGSAVTTRATLDDLDIGPEDEEHHRRVARVKNQRRLIGLAAIGAAVAVAAPAVFEPNAMYVERGAKLDIPSLQDDGRAAKVVPLKRPVKQQKALPTDIATADLPAAESLRKANPVAAGAKPITTPEQKASVKSAKAEPVKTVAKTEKSAAAVKTDAKSTDKAPAASKLDNAPLQAVAHGRYFIQVVATSRRESAEKVAGDLRKLGLPAYTEIVRRRGSDLWRVRVGRFAAEEDARRALDILALNAVSNGGIHTDTK